jgi:DNA-binding NarL/FixJ family response regulator
MKKITVTFISSRNTAQLECAHWVEPYPEIDLVAVSTSPFERSVGTALSRSDVAVIDEDIIRRDGDETLAMLHAGNPRLKFLVIMESFHEYRMLWAITQGVRGVILWCELRQLLGKAIRQIHEGEVWMPRNLLNSFREMINHPGAFYINVESTATNGRLRLH